MGKWPHYELGYVCLFCSATLVPYLWVFPGHGPRTSQKNLLLSLEYWLRKDSLSSFLQITGSFLGINSPEFTHPLTDATDLGSDSSIPQSTTAVRCPSALCTWTREWTRGNKFQHLTQALPASDPCRWTQTFRIETWGIPNLAPLTSLRAFLVAQMVKNMPAMRETGVWSWVGKTPWRRAWQPTLVFLPRETPQTEEPGGWLQSMGLQSVGHD